MRNVRNEHLARASIARRINWFELDDTKTFTIKTRYGICIKCNRYAPFIVNRHQFLLLHSPIRYERKIIDEIHHISSYTSTHQLSWLRESFSATLLYNTTSFNEKFIKLQHNTTQNSQSVYIHTLSFYVSNSHYSIDEMNYHSVVWCIRYQNVIANDYPKGIIISLSFFLVFFFSESLGENDDFPISVWREMIEIRRMIKRKTECVIIERCGHFVIVNSFRKIWILSTLSIEHHFYFKDAHFVSNTS